METKINIAVYHFLYHRRAVINDIERMLEQFLEDAKCGTGVLKLSISLGDELMPNHQIIKEPSSE